jgi:hypothetical protein
MLSRGDAIGFGYPKFGQTLEIDHSLLMAPPPASSLHCGFFLEWKRLVYVDLPFPQACSVKRPRQWAGISPRWKKTLILIPGNARPMFNIVSIRHAKEVKMPSPRKTPPSHEVETDMPSRKKEVAEPDKALGKTQGHKGTQMAKRTKGKSKG